MFVVDGSSSKKGSVRISAIQGNRSNKCTLTNIHHLKSLLYNNVPIVTYYCRDIPGTLLIVL